MTDAPFWLSDAQFARLEALLPSDTRGVPRVDDRRVISGIVHVLKSGCRWKDAPDCYGPRKTLYNRFVRWAAKGVWTDVFHALASAGGPPAAVLIDSSVVKAHRCAAGGKGGAPPGDRALARRTNNQDPRPDGLRLPAAGVPADRRQRGRLHGRRRVAGAYAPDLDPAGRQGLLDRGATPVIPNNPTRKRKHPFDRKAYRLRNVVERTFCRLKDWRRIATRYDKTARNFLAAVTIASIVSYWL